ncbi:MAG: FAD binding domain-containing protein [Methylobacter sp.]|uniref:FAD binding domain-containing protein n=1 Tax=Methylobacter sp. TaxID=2051955 RepID=UPI002585A05E|nr:FAD binding domain-containing protein [Methylobacter sp.]MCL7421888.1 FAD binding domain-containing protein [Methylobacter sp.]
MSRFLLNQRLVEEQLPAGTVMLDVIRRRRGLTGTKDVCREGDCGACQVLLGKRQAGGLRYQAVNACLLPLGAVAGGHVVTVEGLNGERLNPIQQALVDNGAIQCGFCTPGLVMALTGFFLNSPASDEHAAVDAAAGNLCRCTGYTGIRRAIGQLCGQFDLSGSPLARRIEDLVHWQILPPYFLTADETLAALPPHQAAPSPDAVRVAGGTDLFVQKPDWLQAQSLDFLPASGDGIRQEGRDGIVDATTTIEQLGTSPLFRQWFPSAAQDFELICSAPVRARATVGGNLVNASPIADLAVFFLALDARLVIASATRLRTVALKDFFQGYKKTGLQPGERVRKILFDTAAAQHFSYEKVSKRTHLDIAGVNAALSIEHDGGRIVKAHLAAGGIGPVPAYLAAAGACLQGKTIEPATVLEAVEIAQGEITPISDIRGSAEYKRLLLRQLIFAHFLKLFPDTIRWEQLHAR